jgi:DDE superfamily endonuclease
MLALPITFSSVIGVFAPVFSRPVGQHVKVLLPGAVLAPGQRTVTAILRIMGRSAAPDFQTYHRVLNRAVWSPLTASRLLLRRLVAVFIPRGIVVFGLDDTLERRRGAQITAKGIYRDPVRSSHTHGVKASGLRWLGCMLLPPIAWANRVWALPFLTVLCPSERFYAQRGRHHQTVLERAWQSIRLVRCWLPTRELVFVADSSLAALEWLALVARLPQVSVSTRLRLDAALYDPPPPRAPGTKGRPRLTGKRRPTLEAVWADEKTQWSTLTIDNWYGAGPREVDVATDTAVGYHTGKPPVALRWVLMRAPRKCFKPQALLATTLEHTCEQIRAWFVRRWTMDVTWEEARAQLGMETQRQWHDQAIARTTPALLSRYSLMPLTAHLLIEKGAPCVRSTAWYGKKQLLRSSRRNVSPVERIDGPFLMRHEDLACAPVELLEVAKAASCANRVLHHPPKAFDGIEMVATMGR